MKILMFLGRIYLKKTRFSWKSKKSAESSENNLFHQIEMFLHENIRVMWFSSFKCKFLCKKKSAKICQNPSKTIRLFIFQKFRKPYVPSHVRNPSMAKNRIELIKVMHKMASPV
jgi:hypothetical protein